MNAAFRRCLVAITLSRADALGVSAREATQAWINQLVIGQQLCPWAQAALPQMRICTVNFEALKSTVEEEAVRLVEESDAISTTLCVLNDQSLELSNFAAHYNTLDLGELPVDILAFHPQRLDEGPGCSSDPDDAAHYSVRSPFPLYQLLRQDDLAGARDEYAARQRQFARGTPLPGALALLNGNKARLRQVGSSELARTLRSCSTSSSAGVAS